MIEIPIPDTQPQTPGGDAFPTPSASVQAVNQVTNAVSGRSDDCPSTLREVEPWSKPVDGAQLLDDIVTAIKRYVIAEDATFRAATLWAMHTWLMDVWTVSPIASITAPEMRCGKTVLLQALAKLVFRPLSTSNMTGATLYRSIAKWSPTLLIDEADSFLKNNNAARGIVNAGLYRDEAFVMRCASDKHEPTRFSVWGAKALCGIGRLHATLSDRAIPFGLRRMLPGDRVEVIRHSDPGEWSLLRSRIARWSDDHRQELRTTHPEPISDINARANDCWEPLRAIAETAGRNWAEQAKTAAVELHGVPDDALSANAQLLDDIRTIFRWESRRGEADRIFASDLFGMLISLRSEKKWNMANPGEAFSPQRFRRTLGEYGIWSKPIRIGKVSGKNGYERAWFDDAFARYLPPISEETPVLSEF